MSDPGRAPQKNESARREVCYEGPMKTRTLTAVTLVLAAAAGCARLGGAPKSEDDKTLYALGMIIGRNLSDFNLTARELNIVKGAITDTVLKKKATIDTEADRPRAGSLHGQADRRHRVRYVAQGEGRAGHVSAQRRHQVLGRGRRSHEGRRAGDHHVPR